MKNRYDKFVLEDKEGKSLEFGAKKDVTLYASEGTDGELIIRAIRKEFYSENYKEPIIPEGYRHVVGEWNNGFVIERNIDHSQFVWIPVGSLPSNGTIDGEVDGETCFSEKLGRRNWDISNSDYKYYDPFTNELIEQIRSVKKYGGFYISRYNISKNNETGQMQSVRGVMPLFNTNIGDAKMWAATIENKENFKSHLPFGIEYDSVLEWLMKSGAKNRLEIVRNSNKWGNYSDTEKSPKSLQRTGSREEWSANRIYDLAGNLQEWTQEVVKKSERIMYTSWGMARKIEVYSVSRGGNYSNLGEYGNVAERKISDYCNNSLKIGFRVVLWIR